MKELNPFLKEVEKYLDDLPILERNKIISELNAQLQENPELLRRSHLATANEKRIEAGFDSYQVKSSGSTFGRILFKTFAFMFVCFLLFVGFLVWKFTPIFKIDEENQRVTILGGLIDIDGKAGKFIVADEVHFTVSNYVNDLTGEIKLDGNDKPIYIYFESGKFDFETTETSELSFECKLSSPPTDEMINQSDVEIILDFKQLEGSNCAFKIPARSRIITRGNTAAVTLTKPDFDFNLKLEVGNVILDLSEDKSYFLDLNTKTGNLDEFKSFSSNNGEHRIKVEVNTGSISR